MVLFIPTIVTYFANSKANHKKEIQVLNPEDQKLQHSNTYNLTNLTNSMRLKYERKMVLVIFDQWLHFTFSTFEKQFKYQFKFLHRAL